MRGSGPAEKALNKSQRKRAQSQKSTPTKRKRQPTGASLSVANVSVRQVHLQSQKTTRWQQPSETTMSFVMDLIDSNIEETLGGVDTEDYEEIQGVMVRLRERLQTRFTKLKAPLPHVTNYNNLYTTGKSINTEMKSNVNQLARIHDAVEQIEKHIIRMEKKKAKLEQNQTSVTVTEDQEKDQSEVRNDDEMISSLQTLIASMEQMESP